MSVIRLQRRIGPGDGYGNGSGSGNGNGSGDGNGVLILTPENQAVYDFDRVTL